MANKQHQTEIELIKKSSDKRHLAVTLKTNAERDKKLALKVIDALLSYDVGIPENEAIDWIMWIIAGGKTFDEFTKIIKEFNDSPTCGLVWTSDFIAYRCRTCSVSPCMSLCADCFNTADHTGHDYNMFRSQSGGACDCGDATVMHSDGFCPKHGPNRPTVKTAVPPDLLVLPKLLLPKLLCSLLVRFRSFSFCNTDGEQNLDKIILQYIQLVQNLVDSGTITRSLIAEILIDKDLYKEFILRILKYNNLVNLPFDFDYELKSQIKYETAKSQLIPKKFPIEFNYVENLEDETNIKHLCLLDEFMFWIVYHHFPQQMVTLILSILPDIDYKLAFCRTFVLHYSRTALILERAPNNNNIRKNIANRVVHISVQILSPKELAMTMINDWALIHRMLSALNNMLQDVFEPILIIDGETNQHLVLNCDRPVMKEHSFWPIISDLINILSHKEAALILMNDDKLLDFFIRFISKMQCINTNSRELGTHVEIEQETYYAAFNAELEMSASPMWCLVSAIDIQCNDTIYLRSVENVLKLTVDNLLTFLDIIKIRMYTKPSPLQISFHLPLHRYVAIFFHMLTKFSRTQTDLLQMLADNHLTSDRIQLIIAHPLQIQIVCAEIAIDMWVRNGLQIKGQMMTYRQTHFCNSMADPDIYLLQLACCCLQSDHFLRIILERFHVIDLLTLADNGSISTTGYSLHLKPENEQPMLESCLTFLLSLLSIRLMVGWNNDDILNSEVVALLSINDRTYSQLSEMLPEKCGSTSTESSNIKEPLAKFAVYKPPQLSSTGIGLHQGTYIPNSKVWLENYDPIFTNHRSLTRRDYQNSLNRFTKFIKKENLYNGNCSPWPPYRIPNQLNGLYTNLMDLLHCRSLHAILFVLLKQALDGKLSEACTALAVHLLYLSLNVEPSNMKRADIAFEDDVPILENSQNKRFPFDKIFEEWMPSDSIMKNMGHLIENVKVAEIAPNHHRSMDEPYSTANLETDLDEAPNIANIQGKSSIDISGSLVTLPPVASKSTCTQLKRVTKIIEVNMRMVDILIALYKKFSVKKQFKPTEMLSNISTPPIGDGEFFIGRILAQLYYKDDEFKNLIKEELMMNNSNVEIQKDEKRQRAAERQKKIMEKMQKQQQKIKSKFAIEDDNDTNLGQKGNIVSGNDNLDNDLDNVDEHVCIICNKSGPSTSHEPIGIVSFVSLTAVLGHRGLLKRIPIEDKPSDCPENCGGFWRLREQKLRRLFDSKVMQDAQLNSWSNGVHLETCGHYVHISCVNAYRKSQLQRSREPDTQIFSCPLCRRSANCVLPYIQPSDNSKGITKLSNTNLDDDNSSVNVNDQISELKFKMGIAVTQSLPSTKSRTVFLPKRLSYFANSSRNHTPLPIENESILTFEPISMKCNRNFCNEIDCRNFSVLFNNDATKRLSTSALSDSIKNVFEQFISTAHNSDENIENNLQFMASVLGHNILSELQDGIGQSPFGRINNSKRSCLMQLLDTLAINCKQLSVVNQGGPKLWSLLTSYKENSPNEDSGQSNSSIQLYVDYLPILVRDPITVFLHLILCMQPPLAKNIYADFVQAVLNLNIVQAIISITLQMSSEELAAWSRNDSDRIDGLENLLNFLIKTLTEYGLYNVELSSDNMCDLAINGCIMSFECIKSTVDMHCLQFLRVAVHLKTILFDDEILPTINEGELTEEKEILKLLEFLNLQQLSNANNLSVVNCLKFYNFDDNRFTRTTITTANTLSVIRNSNDGLELIKQWCLPIRDLVIRAVNDSKFLLNCPPKFLRAKLIDLPDRYEKLFANYHKSKCPTCLSIPKDPAVCLVCSRMVCFKGPCCRDGSVYETAKHSKECGAGTSLYLIINTSFVVVFKTNTAAHWGSVYLDEHGEEDRNLRRGKPLFLSRERYERLEEQWAKNELDRACQDWVTHNYQF